MLKQHGGIVRSFVYARSLFSAASCPCLATSNESEVSRPNLMRVGGLLLFKFAMLIMLTVLLEYIDLWYKYLAKHFLLCWRFA